MESPLRRTRDAWASTQTAGSSGPSAGRPVSAPKLDTLDRVTEHMRPTPRIGWALLLAATALASLSIAFGSSMPSVLADDSAPKDEVERKFRKLDRDGDGKVSRKELTNRARFDRLDANGDGAITLEEARAAQSSAPAKKPAKKPTRGEAEPPPMPELTQHLGLPYAKIKGVAPKELSLDLYAPKKKGKHAVMVMIHGGAWSYGNKSDQSMRRYKVPHFVGAGYVYVSINYRLSKTPAVKHPAHVKDVAKALAWVHDNVAKYGGDPDRIFVMGHSAGAHLAVLVATDHRRLKAEGKSLSMLKGVISLDTAAYDVSRAIHELRGGPRVRAIFEKPFGKTKDAWLDASPAHHVAPKKGIPPMLVFYTRGLKTGGQLSKDFVQQLRTSGTPAFAVHASDKDHGGINWCIGQVGDPYTSLVMRFLEQPQDADKLSLKPPKPRKR